MLKTLSAFAQTRANTTVSARDDAEDDSKARVLESIEQLGQRLHKTALIALAYRAASDPVGKTRGMIEETVAEPLQEAAEEATRKAFCDKSSVSRRLRRRTWRANSQR